MMLLLFPIVVTSTPPPEPIEVIRVPAENNTIEIKAEDNTIIVSVRQR